MENANTKMETMKPALLKAGIPLAISVASFIFAKMLIKKVSFPRPSSSDSNQIHNDESHDSLEFPSQPIEKAPCHRVDSAPTSFKEVDHIRVEPEVEEEISSMRIRIKDIQEQVYEQETRFIHYYELKEREVMIMEVQNKLFMEIISIEFLEKEVSSMEADSNRINNMVLDYMKITEVLQLSRSENRLLHKRVKKLLKEKNLLIEVKEEEISRNHEELKRKGDVISTAEDELKKLKMKIEQLQSENHELLNQINLAEKSALLKNDSEVVIIDDYNKLAYELEQVQKDRASEKKELVFLRWSHACLRHQLMRSNQEKDEIKNHQELHYGSDNELGSTSSLELGNPRSCLGLGFPTGGHHHSKRRTLLAKLKKWVDHGSDQILKENSDHGKEKHLHKFFRKGSPDNNVILPARKSCSSA